MAEPCPPMLGGRPAHSMYFDNDLGLWVCRKCTTTMSMEEAATPHDYQGGDDDGQRGKGV